MKPSFDRIVTEIAGLTAELEPELIELRRHFHQYPELSWGEVQTSERVASLLRAQDCRVDTEFLKTAVVAERIGDGDGPTLAIRADMDALPLQDMKEVPYRSRVEGVLHACGHDVHMAIAVGVARVLGRLNVPLSGRLRFIFQPSEEASPSGAEELVRHGVMDGVDAVVAFHVDPEIAAGEIGLREGVLTAHCNEFRVVVRGKAGHAARPHQAVDAIHLTQQVLASLYDLVGGRTQPHLPAVLTIGRVQGGTKANIIPDEVEILGTVRTVDDRTRRELLEGLEQRVKLLCEGAGGGYELELLPHIPSVMNDAHLIRYFREVGEATLGAEHLVDIDRVSLGGEDFSWYATRAPGALVRLGSHKPSDIVRYLHTRHFDVDERAISVGVRVLSAFAVRYLTASQV